MAATNEALHERSGTAVDERRHLFKKKKEKTKIHNEEFDPGSG